jgi:hypothetical protein
MDDIKIKGGKSRVMATRVGGRPVSRVRHIYKTHLSPRPGRARKVVKSLGQLAAKNRHQKRLRGLLPHRLVKYVPKQTWQRVYAAVTLWLFVMSLIAMSIQPFLNDNPYYLNDAARKVLPRQSESFAKLIEFDNKTEVYNYNQSYTGQFSSENGNAGDGVARINASMGKDPAKGMTVKDPVNGVDITLKPKFRLLEGKQDQNQILYRLGGAQGYLVYTAQVTGVKEDILLGSYKKDKMVFEYELNISSALEARLEKNGSIGVYGTDLPIMGDVSTGTDKDKELLEKARQKADKNKLIFTIPKPVVVESNKTTSGVNAYFELKGKTVRVVAEKLKNANYPLSIDPSVYVETAQRLMRGNNETNLDFDVTNELIQKGKLTGARFNSWTSSLALPAARHGQATVVYGGYIYAVGGNNGSANQATVYWAKLNTTTGAIEAPNPGNGACASWCTETVYNLPATRAGHSLVAYNGYLFVLGGHESTPATPATTVYIAKLGLNGEPALWHPTDTNKNNWAYWYTSDITLATASPNNGPGARTYASAMAYNNKLYILGGYSGTTGTTTVHVTDIRPNGTISSWSTAGMVALTAARFGHSSQIYNDRIYVIGGASSTTATSNVVYYMKLNSDGTMAGTAWSTTTAILDSAGAAANTMSAGGSFATIWGGYMYIAGGCSGVSTTSNVPSCATAVHNDVRVASINADGTVSDWQTIGSTVQTSRTNYGLTAWRGVLYGIGGCTTLTCSSGVTSATSYGVINQDGDASTVSSSDPDGTGNCTSGNNYKYCDLPPQGDGNGQGGRLAAGTVITNGYIYHIGGCTAVGGGNVCYSGNSGKVSDTISFASISSDGRLSRVPSTVCTGSGIQYYGHWCVDNSSGHTINGTTGLVAFGTGVFNNTIYVVGGTNGTQWQESIWYMTPSSNGLPGSWTSQTFSAIGITNTVSTPAQSAPSAARGYSYVFTRSNPSSAGTNPGNLYILGGCTGLLGPGDNGLDCDAQFYDVYKCNISTTNSVSGCATTNQLRIDSEPGTSGDQGLGVMAGAVYANYIYLVGGQSPNNSERGSIIYAKFDNNNNIVDADGETAVDNIWTTSSSALSPVRRRGVAFGYNGYLYALAGYNVSQGGSLNDLLLAKINTSDGSIGSFTTSNVTVDARWDLRAVVNNGYVYAMGGCREGAPPADCTAMTGGVQIFQLYNNYSGSPAQYVYQTTGYAGGSSTPYAGDKLGHGSVIVNGYLYIAGGCTGLGDCTATSDQVSYAKIDAFGYLGAWTNSGALDGWRLPAGRGWGQLEAVGGTLYFIGGQTTAATVSTVYWTTPNASTGAITSWSTATKGIGQRAASPTQSAQTRTKFGATVWNNRIYIVGGLSGMADSTAQNTLYISPNLSGGGDITGDWVTNGAASTPGANGTNFNIARSGLTAITYANNLYILGGADASSNILADVQFAKITEITNEIYVSGWTYTTSLVDKLFGADGFAYNGFMYLFGGKASANVCETNTIAAPISANTTIASGNNPTGIGDWFETNVKYNGSRYGASVAYYDGKGYLSGGACNSTLTYVATADKMTHTTLLAQPQVAKYSRMIDTDTDVFPNTWLLNGLDNDIGARWNMRYRSSTNGWAYRRRITLSNSQSTENLVNFPIRVSLTSSNIDYSKTQDQGQDLRFYDSDGATLLKHEIEKWDESGTSEVWVRVPQIDANSNTDFIYMYYGNSNASDGQDAAGLWGTNAKAVWHLHDNYNSSTGSNNGTNNGSVNIAGQIADGDDFESADNTDNINVGTWSVSGSALTMSAWVRFESLAAGADHRLISKGNGSGAEDHVTMLGIQDVGGGAHRLRTRIKTGTSDTSGTTTLLGTTNLSANTWYHVAVTYDGANIRLYLNGVQDASVAKTGSLRQNSWTMLLGNQPGALGNTQSLDGILDEAKILDVTRSAEWLEAEHKTTNNAMNTFGSEEGGASPVWGQETNFGIVTLGKVEQFIPKDVNGVNTNFARYYYIYITIDSSQAYGYPEDVTRGPTIADFTLFFTSDPGKRLKHGKTFTGGEQMPLDTPCRDADPASPPTDTNPNDDNCPAP